MCSQRHNLRQDLSKLIDNATCINDLIPILERIDLLAVKKLIKEQLQTEEQFPCLSSLNMTKILPLDIVQHVVSFNNFSTVKRVNKAFNECFKKNKKKELLHREQTIIKQSIRCSNAPRKTWVVPPTNNETSTLAFTNAIKQANDGDRIVINSALEELQWEYSSLTIDKALEIVGGAGNEVSYQKWNIKANVYFKNLRIDMGLIQVHGGATVFLEQCHVDYGTINSDIRTGGICVYPNASLFAFNCKFDAEYLDFGDCHAIFSQNYRDGTICVSGCEFVGFGGHPSDPLPCVRIDMDDDDDKECVQLTMIDNLFGDSVTTPLAPDMIYSGGATIEFSRE